ncbi:MAG: hypothetical protein MJZ64_07195 [Paludibacteraceae bacterium]|nr:hypothetical protein [Paludibacteraceae bacterium]
MKQQIQYILAVVMCTAGMVLIFLCIYIDPKGEIHYSALVAYGEILTFVGAIMGIDYHYRYPGPPKS